MKLNELIQRVNELEIFNETKKNTLNDHIDEKFRNLDQKLKIVNFLKSNFFSG